MKQVKFRGKEAKTGGWLYGYYVEQHMPEYDNDQPELITGYTHLPVLFNDEPGHRNSCYWHEVVYNTVCQFTGLQDKKGVDIYDGDIIYVKFADGSGGYHLVGWNEENASWGIMDAYSYQAQKEGYDFAEFKNYVLIAFLRNALIFEVAGNIYDNPDLLETNNLKQ